VEWFESNDPWYPSKWGPDDEYGSLNALVPEKILRATKLVKEGRVYRLGHLIYHEMPTKTSIHGPFYYVVSQRVYDHRLPIRKQYRNKFGAMLCRLELVDHLGTHIDALNHIAYDNKFYNGVDAYWATTQKGTLKLGIDSTPPIVTRGIMIDVTRIVGREILDKGYAITINDAETFLREEGLKIEPGDAILFYTGVSKLWMEPTKYNEFFDHSPGVGYELAKWCAEKDPAVVGADTPATEVVPSELGDVWLPVHQYLITKCGIRIIDNLKLDELAKDKVYEFLFICSPLPIKGGTASPVAPVAVI
jgi:kynurenine formamidase